jgi:alkylation response protein AidB-like acyl-CoA dehydrogenase
MSGVDLISRKLMLNSLKQYVKKKLPLDLLQELDKNNEYPQEIINDFYDPDVLGVNYLLIPKEYGGIGGSSVDIYQACEILGRTDLGISTTVFASFLGCDPILVGGTPEQKKKWMTKVADEELVVAYGATESDAGSHLVGLKTRARRIEENGKVTGYRITGNKQWISNGGVADLYTILALAPGGASWFVVERGAEGFSSDKHEDKHGIRLSNTTGLALDDVFVPVENLIGGVEGQGFVQAQVVFGYTRLMVAALSLGAGSEAVETAIRYAQQRIQAEGPLSEKMGYMHKLIVPHAVNLEAARSYIDRISRKLDEVQEGYQTEGAIAKYYASEMADNAADDAIQALGGYGYTKDFAVEKIKRDVKITKIYEGTSEILSMTIQRNRWQEHLKSQGKFYLEMAKEMDQVHAKNPKIGADSAALCLKGLAAILEVCRTERLTRHQHVQFKIGDLIARAEVTHGFVFAASQDKYFDGVRFDKETYEAMARVHSRESSFSIVSDGIKLVSGAGNVDANALAAQTGLVQIMAKQQQITQDMDMISAKLCEIFNAK